MSEQGFSRRMEARDMSPSSSHGETGSGVAKMGKAAGTAAAACFGYAVIMVGILPFLRPDYDATVNWISDYAVGPFGWLQTSVFVVTSLGVLALLVGLIRAGPANWIARTGIFFLSVLVPGLIVAALFQTDLPHHKMTQHGLIHTLDALINFLSGLVAALFLAASFGDDPRWRGFRGAALILAVFTVVALVGQILVDALRLPGTGVGNRVFAGSLILWLLLTALHLRKVPDRQA